MTAYARDVSDVASCAQPIGNVMPTDTDAPSIAACRRWFDMIASGTGPLPAPAPTTRQCPAPRNRAFLELGIEGQHYEASVVGTRLSLRAKQAYDTNGGVACELGRAMIEAQHDDDDAPTWYLEDAAGNRLLLHLSPAGVAAFALAFGVPVRSLLPPDERLAVTAENYFYASAGYEALRAWADAAARRPNPLNASGRIKGW